MPTAPKLVAALLFAALAYYASEAIKTSFPEGMDFGHFVEVNAAIGALAGWFVMGRLVREGYALAVAAGLRTTAVLVFYALLVQALVKAYDRAMNMRYGDPVEAVLGVVGITWDYALVVLTAPTVMAILLIGGVLAALLVEAVSHIWN